MIALCDTGAVPLSENEQRILSEIEAQLYESDPALAREVGSTTVFSHAMRNIKWAAVGFVAGVIFMISTLSTSFLIAFIGFLVMLASALFIERNARLLGRAGIQQMTQNVPNLGLGNRPERFRRRPPEPEDKA